MSLLRKQKSGFTIIEVVLVLAIAGMIFLMVFIGLPALQRSQRDTARKNDVNRLAGQLTQYAGSNRGRLPGEMNGQQANATFKGETQLNNQIGNQNAWAYFYHNYMLARNETFEDPSGGAYSLNVVLCGGATPCAAGQKNTMSFQDQKSDANLPNAINVVINAQCDGEQATADNSDRRAALLYKLEGGGTICVNV